MSVLRIMVGLLMAALCTLLCTLLVGVSPASAATVEECQASLGSLRQDTVDAGGSFTNEKDLSGLVARLDNAAAKLADDKFSDAVAKVVAYQNTLAALAVAPKPKVEPSTASSLSAGAQAVIECISSRD